MKCKLYEMNSMVQVNINSMQHNAVCFLFVFFLFSFFH